MYEKKTLKYVINKLFQRKENFRVFFLLTNEFQFDSYRLKRLDETYYEGETKNVLIDYRCVY